MANYYTGYLKLSGKKEDLLRFFQESLIPKVHDSVVVVENDDSVWVRFPRQIHHWIKDMRRAYLYDDKSQLLPLGGGRFTTGEMNFSQASCVNAEDLMGIADKFFVDIEAYGSDYLMSLACTVEIQNGQLVKNELSEHEAEEYEIPDEEDAMLQEIMDRIGREHPETDYTERYCAAFQELYIDPGKRPGELLQDKSKEQGA